jgi:hypothetical protein
MIERTEAEIETFCEALSARYVTSGEKQTVHMLGQSLAFWLRAYLTGAEPESIMAYLGQVLPPIPAPPAPTPRPEMLRAEGRSFYRPDGSLARIVGASAFAWALRLIDGEDVSPTLAWWRKRGVTHPRIFMMLSWTPGAQKVLSPADLDNVLAYLHRENFAADVVLLADCQRIPGCEKLDWQKRHVQAHRSVLVDHPQAIAELGNEWRYNGWCPADFALLDLPQPWSMGSAGGEEAPPVGGTFLSYEPGRSDDYMRKCGKQGAEHSYLGADDVAPAGVPAWDVEPMGYDETYQPGRRDNSPLRAYDAACCSFLFLPAYTFHSEAGLLGNVPGPVTDACMAAVAQAARDVPLDAHLGHYTRGGLDDCPLEHSDDTALRTYAMIAPDGRTATALVVDKWYVGTPKARGDWAVRSTLGDRQQLVFLER